MSCNSVLKCPFCNYLAEEEKAGCYVLNSEEVEGAYCFGLVRPFVRPFKKI